MLKDFFAFEDFFIFWTMITDPAEKENEVIADLYLCQQYIKKKTNFFLSSAGANESQSFLNFVQ
jgi:hypothetical protein